MTDDRTWPEKTTAEIIAALHAEATRLHAAIVPHDVGPMTLSTRHRQEQHNAQQTRNPHHYLTPPPRKRPHVGARSDGRLARARTRGWMLSWWRRR